MFAAGATVSVADDVAAYLVGAGLATFEDTQPGIEESDDLYDWGVSPAASATSNTLTLKAALMRGGTLRLQQPGTYLLNDTLVIRSNTTLELGPRVILKQTPGTHKAMLVNAAFSTRATMASITIAWTSTLEASVTWTAHGLVADDAIWVRGANQPVYNNVHRVLRVTDANTVVIALPYLPTTTATGTILAKKCDSNIHTIGGTFDYDYANNLSAAAGPDRHTIVIGACADFTIQRVRSVNAYKFAIHVGAVREYVIADCFGEGIQGASSSEAIKTYGPAQSGHVTNLSGRTSDDFASIQTKEAADFAAYDWSGGGDIFDVVYDGIHGENSGGSMLTGLYLSDNERADNITFRNVTGYAGGASASGLKVQNGSGYTLGQAGTINIENCAVRKLTGASQYNINAAANIRVLNILRPVFSPETLTAVFFRQTSGTINTLNVEAPSIDNTTWPSSAQFMFVLAGTKVDVANFRGGHLTTTVASGEFLSISCPFDVITVEGFNFNDGAQPIVLQTSASSGRKIVNLVGNRFFQTAHAFRYFHSCTVNSRGNVFDTLTDCFLGSAAVNMKLYSQGNTYISAIPFVSAAGATIEIYGWDIAVDPIALTGLAATVGQFLTSTQAGTEGGPAVLTPAGWVALGTGASGVNTVIA